MRLFERPAGKERLCASARKGLAVLCLGLAAGTRLAADGEPRWGGQPYVMESSSRFPKIESSPSIDAAGTLYVGVRLSSGGAVVALPTTSETNVNETWRRTFSDWIVGSPLLAPNGRIYVGCYDGVFYALDKATGQIVNAFDTNQPLKSTYIHGSAALSPDGQTLYVGVSTSPTVLFQPSPSRVMAFTTDLRLKWESPVGDVVESSPAVAPDGTIYIGCADHNLYAFTPDGQQTGVVALDGEIAAAPAIGGDGTVYVGTLANEFAAISPDLRVKYQYPLTVLGAAAIGPDGTVYVGNWADGNLYALTPGGAGFILKWTAPGRPGLGSAPTVRADGTILFGSDDKMLRAYAPDGTVKWSAALGAPIDSNVVIAPTPDHSLFVGTSGGALFAFRGNEYDLSGYASWPTFQHDFSRSGRAAPRISGGQLINLSTRGYAGPANTVIAGFVVTGSGSKQLLVRAVGPTLVKYGVAAPLPNPVLDVHITSNRAPNSDLSLGGPNDDWGASPFVDQIREATAASGAFPLPEGSFDAATVISADPALAYSAAVTSADARSGPTLVEVYDTRASESALRLINLSTRGTVGTGDNMLIAGVVVGGTGPLRVLIRGIGPGLIPYGVTGTLARPTITLRDVAGGLLAANSGWTTTQAKADIAGAATLSGAFPLNESNSDAAMITTLVPGLYTIQLSGVGATTGEGLVEVYALPW